MSKGFSIVNHPHHSKGTDNRLRPRQRRAARMGRTAARFGIGSIVPFGPKSVVVLP